MNNLLLLLLLLGVAGCNNSENLLEGPTRPVPGESPAQGSFVLLESPTDEFIGDGLNLLYTLADSEMSIEVEGALLTINIEGDEDWTGNFQLPNSFLQLEAGTYPSMQRFPFHNELFGGLTWSGDGRGCNESESTLIIDSVTFDGDILTNIELSFEQACIEQNPQMLALSGTFRWDVSDQTVPPGPVTDVPPDLWEPDAAIVPDTGNYVILSSTFDDFVGDGLDYLYTDGTAIFDISEVDGVVSVNVAGFEDWSGDFVGMDFLTELEAGYYPDLQRYPFNNPVKGGLNWSGEGRGCNKLEGWFVVDSITFEADTLTAIELRFEQLCQLSTTPLYGAVRWSQ